MARQKLTGIYIPVVTPFNEDESINFAAIDEVAKFLAENGETASDRLGSVGEEGPNQRFSATLSVPLTDHITLSALLVPPDGTRQTQLLERYDGLYTASLPSLRLNSFPEKLRRKPGPTASWSSLPGTWDPTRKSCTTTTRPSTIPSTSP